MMSDNYTLEIRVTQSLCDQNITNYIFFRYAPAVLVLDSKCI